MPSYSGLSDSVCLQQFAPDFAKPMADRTNFSFSPNVVDDLLTLLNLSTDQVEGFAKLVMRYKRVSDFPELLAAVADKFELEADGVYSIVNPLMFINESRIENSIPPEAISSSLKSSVVNACAEEDTPLPEDLERKLQSLEPLFKPDNYLSIIRKTFNLWSQRPRMVDNFKVLTELRPVFNEDGESVLGLMVSNTLVVEFEDSEEPGTTHISLDIDQLTQLQEEISRAIKKARALSDVAGVKDAEMIFFSENSEREK